MGPITDLRNPFRVDIELIADFDHLTNLTAERSLHICPGCESPLVQPTCWEQESDRSHWRVWRRCPECEWVGDGVHGEVAIDDFDEQLDLGSFELDDELQALEHAIMSEMAGTFVIALERDLIGPGDFRV
jgi:hypothetical protein